MCRGRGSFKLFIKVFLACCVVLIYLQFQLLSGAERNHLAKILQFKEDEYVPEVVEWTKVCSASSKREKTRRESDDFKQHEAGNLNVLLWENITGSSIISFITYPLFPSQPSRISLASSAYVKLDALNYGQWIVGYLHADVTGDFKFALSSDDSSELWISTDERPENARKIAQVGWGSSPGWTRLGQHSKYVDQVSSPITLRKCKNYFIEIVHKQSLGNGFVAVSWKLPQGEDFHIIASTYLSPLFRMTSSPFIPEQFENFKAALKRRRKNKLSLEAPADYIDVQRLDHKFIKKAFPKCLQETLNLNPQNKQEVQRSLTAVYPASKEYKTFLSKDDDEKVLKALQDKQDGLTEEKTKAIVYKYLGLLEEVYPGNFNLKSITKVERKTYRGLRDRYLLDLMLEDNHQKTTLRLATYVYKSWGEDSLCAPEELRWDDHTLVQVVVVITKPEHDKWAISLIDNLEDISQRKANVQLIIFHYGQEDFAIERALSANSLLKRLFIHRTDGFNYANVIQEALHLLEDEKSISMLVDPHMKLPLDMLDQTRKHCFQGKMAFSPIAFHLKPGNSPAKPEGLWDARGLSALAMYKDDWRRLLQSAKAVQSDDNQDSHWKTFEHHVESVIEVERFKMDGLFFIHE